MAQSIDDMADWGPREVNTALSDWVEHLYQQGTAEHVAVEGLLAYAQRNWWHRALLTPAWRLVSAWQTREPMETRRPIAPIIAKAVIATAFAWELPLLAVFFWLLFHALLRPGEALLATVADLVFLSEVDDLGWLPRSVIMKIRFSKTRKRGPRRQHVTITDAWLVELLKKHFRYRPPNMRLFPYGQALARSRLRSILQALNAPPNAFSLGSFRPGGASYEFLLGMTIGHLKFRGRWGAESTLDHYIQECLAALDLASLPCAALERIRAMAGLLPELAAAS